MKTIATMLILIATMFSVGFASTSKDKQEVKAFLHARLQWGLGKSNKQVDVKNLKHLGTRTLRVLADFLPDYNLGDTAADVMLEIDSRQAASDAMPQQPSQEAANALGELVHKAPPDNYESTEYWKKWYAKSHPKQQRLRR